MAVNINDRLKEFIEGIQGMGLGTRDNNFVPHYCRGLGAVVTGDNTIKLFIAEPTSLQAIKNLANNKMVSLILASPLNFESYQFKGTFISNYDATEEDERQVDDYLNKFSEILIGWGLNEGVAHNWLHKPLIVIEFEVEHVFEQTPKKGTGNKIEL